MTAASTKPAGTSWWRRARELNASLGTGTSLLYVADRILGRLSGGRARLVVYGIYAQPLQGTGTAPMRADTRWAVIEVNPGHTLCADFPRPASVIEARWAAGSRCFCLTRDGAFVGYIWTQTGAYLEDEIHCRYVLSPQATTVWDYDVFVVPAHRASRAMFRLWSEVDRRLFAEGRQWSLSRIALFNAASVRSHERLGAQRTGWVLALVWPGLQLTVTRSRPWLHWWPGRGEGPDVPARPPAETA
jgi:hypothetical protein